MKKDINNSRAVAAGIIAEWLETDRFPDRLVGRVSSDRAFVTELAYGAIRRKNTLEWIIGHFASATQKYFVLACLMTGIYQLFFMDNTEAYAAVNETVNAVKSRDPSAGGFVNGVLRNFQRQADMIRAELKNQPLETRESHPVVLTKKWTGHFGSDKCEELCRHNNTRPGTVIIPNILRTTTDAYKAMLEKAGIDFTPHPFAPDQCLQIQRGIDPPSLPGFSDGFFTIQDPSTTVSVDLLDAQPGDNILDACAAPGGKAMLTAQATKDTGRLIAMDIHADRLAVLEENVKRMRLNSVNIIKGNTSDPEDIRRICPDGGFHRILLDVPCTNTGVLRRRPDARWRFSEKRMKELAITQESLLNSAARFLKPGGTLVYSTCSLEPEEGRELLTVWLAKNSEFQLKDMKTTWPPETGTDGIFAASIIQKT